MEVGSPLAINISTLYQQLTDGSFHLSLMFSTFSTLVFFILRPLEKESTTYGLDTKTSTEIHFNRAQESSDKSPLPSCIQVRRRASRFVTQPTLAHFFLYVMYDIKFICIESQQRVLHLFVTNLKVELLFFSVSW